MGHLAEELGMLPSLRTVGAVELHRAASTMRRVDLAAGQALWAEGAPADTLALLLYGELAVYGGAREIARVRAPDVVGEVGAFVVGATRAASLRATVPSTLAVLDVDTLRALRHRRSRLYDVLLDLAQRSTVRRIQANNARLAQLVAGGYAAPARREPGAVVRLWRALRPGGPKGPCPPVEPLLLAQPGLEELTVDDVVAIGAAFVAEPMAEGQVIVLEGEPAAGMYLVAEGSVDVLRNVRGDRAELLTTLGPGQTFGANALVDAVPRSASCVAATAGWLYLMHRDAFDALTGDARRDWRESVLVTLASQLRGVTAALEKAMAAPGRRGAGAPSASSGAPPGAAAADAHDDGFGALLEASGYVESLPAHERALGALKFVADADHERNRRNRLSRRPPGAS